MSASRCPRSKLDTPDLEDHTKILVHRCNMTNNTKTAPAPISWTPSPYWDGNDGLWNTFTLSVGSPPQDFRIVRPPLVRKHGYRTLKAVRLPIQRIQSIVGFCVEAYLLPE